MERAAVVVWGKNKSGKSTSILVAYDDLVARPGVQVLDTRRRRHGSDVHGSILLINGVKVLITSRGDSWACLEEDLLEGEPLHVKDCPVIVCARHPRTERSRGRSPDDFVNLYLRPHYTIAEIEKVGAQQVQQRDTENRETADKVISAVLHSVQRV